MKQVKIVNGKRGFHLRVNGLYIRHGFDASVTAITNEVGIPYGATEWVSVNAIRDFWRKYMPLIIASTARPFQSVWGQLILID